MCELIRLVVQVGQWEPLFFFHSSTTPPAPSPCSSLADHSPKSHDPLFKPFKKEPAATLRYYQGSNSYAWVGNCNIFSWLPYSLVVERVTSMCRLEISTCKMMSSVVQVGQWEPLFNLCSSATPPALPPCCSSLGNHSPKNHDPIFKPFTKEPAATLCYN